MKVKLNSNEVKFLTQYIRSSEIKDLIKTAGPNQLEIELNLKALEEICDELTDLLTTIGLNESDEPNAIGFQIEGLIDKFNYYDNE